MADFRLKEQSQKEAAADFLGLDDDSYKDSDELSAPCETQYDLENFKTGSFPSEFINQKQRVDTEIYDAQIHRKMNMNLVKEGKNYLQRRSSAMENVGLGYAGLLTDPPIINFTKKCPDTDENNLLQQQKCRINDVKKKPRVRDLIQLQRQRYMHLYQLQENQIELSPGSQLESSSLQGCDLLDGTLDQLNNSDPEIDQEDQNNQQTKLLFQQNPDTICQIHGCQNTQSQICNQSHFGFKGCGLSTCLDHSKRMIYRDGEVTRIVRMCDQTKCTENLKKELRKVEVKGNVKVAVSLLILLALVGAILAYLVGNSAEISQFFHGQG